MRAISSFRLSRCCTFSVAHTSMPASSSSATSSQRLLCRLPGALVCASSSTSSSPGWRASAASTSNSSSTCPRYAMVLRGSSAKSAICRSVPARPCVSTTPISTSRPPARARWAEASISHVLPTPGAAPRNTFRQPRCSRAAAARRASGSGRGGSFTVVSKAFFFEKKKQKTFAPCRRVTGEVRCGEAKAGNVQHLQPPPACHEEAIFAVIFGVRPRSRALVATTVREEP